MWVFLLFLSPGIYGHCCSKRLPITKEPKRKRADRNTKGHERQRKRLGGCISVQYFLLRGQSWVSFSTNRVLIPRSPGVKHKLLHCLCHVDFLWLFSLFLFHVLQAGVQWHRCKEGDLWHGNHLLVCLNKAQNLQQTYWQKAFCRKKMKKTFPANKRLFKRMKLRINSRYESLKKKKKKKETKAVCPKGHSDGKIAHQ